MTALHPPAPAVPGPVPPDRLTAGFPPVREVDVAALAAQVAAGRTLVVLDDDPTGTQSITDLPVLTSWSVDDLRWALRQDSPAFFVLTNTRSLGEEAAAARGRDLARALAAAAEAEGVDYVLASRSDSTLRGHYPLETDVLARELAAAGRPVDGVVIVPAFIEPGRLTVGSVHWMRTGEGMIPVSHSEFARDATFGYANADLRDWVEEKTGGRIRRADVATVTLHDLRAGGPERVADVLGGLRDGQPVVVDAATDDDLRVLVQGLLAAEDGGGRFLYRTGPSFVRARSGQAATPPTDADRLRAAMAVLDDPTLDPRPRARHGLIAVGSHVALTTRQLDRLRAAGGIVELELDVPTLLDADRGPAHVAATVDRAVELLAGGADGDLVVRTSRTLVPGRDPADSLAIARMVSAALVAVVREVVARIRPAFVLAKGGITSSDTATAALAITRAWSRGTLLPGTVSVWEPVSGPARGVPYVVFAGNVGDDDALVGALRTLRSL
ncbi:four-carbon acid sugar kinase family protein [Pseudonocardia nigra]|uniref:four-carbon acid sugar kinase family protein n=1 Tax=Pseudonocardia nigra TaxID=1921578 RepID=UPI001C5FA634|nr:four-carbon acid sugar kinase family protein [Pseudonocardia nigra]